ncbi:MAG: glucose-6-phosphate isomerase, partial [Bacteroidales bacterium]|nr:glucose-6-phosphate isomerase [Bacteroidales bacterium]
MKNISLNSDKVIGTIPEKLYDIVSEEVLSAYKTLTQKAGLGNDFLGWLSLPDDISEDEINSIYNEVARLRNKAQKIVAIGIGGSYLGAKAVIEALKEENKPACEVIFAGQNLNGAYLHNLLNDLDASDYAIIVISKSGTTTEPAIAFRIIKQHLERKYGAEEAAKRIIAITDANKGTLHDMAKTAGYATFVIPDNVGGRYSVLTPVGLLPIAFAGYDIKELIKGAKDMQALCSDSDNVAVQYAVLRYCLYALNYNVEVFVNYLRHLTYVSEWWKQLY